MSPQNIESKGLEEAFLLWSRHYPRKGQDEQCSPTHHQIRHTREALFLSQKELARRIKISPAKLSDIEQNEHTQTLQQLTAIADAIDCELVYFIRPCKQKTFARRIWEQLLPLAIEHPHVQQAPQERKHRVLAATAKTLMKNKKVRKQLGWSSLNSDFDQHSLDLIDVWV